MKALADAVLYEALYQDKLQRYRAYNWSTHKLTREGYANFPLPQVAMERFGLKVEPSCPALAFPSHGRS